MFAMLWVLPGSILAACVCCLIIGLLGFISDYDGMTETTAVVMAVIAGVLTFGSWFLIQAIVGSSAGAILPWIITALIIVVVVSIPIGLLVSWAQGTGGIEPL